MEKEKRPLTTHTAMRHADEHCDLTATRLPRAMRATVSPQQTLQSHGLLSVAATACLPKTPTSIPAPAARCHSHSLRPLLSSRLPPLLLIHPRQTQVSEDGQTDGPCSCETAVAQAETLPSLPLQGAINHGDGSALGTPTYRTSSRTSTILPWRWSTRY